MAQKAMVCKISVRKISRDGSQVVDGGGVCSVVRIRARPGRAESGELAVRTAEEAMKDIIRVLISPCDSAPGINPVWICPIVVARLRIGSRSLEADDSIVILSTRRDAVAKDRDE